MRHDDVDAAAAAWHDADVDLRQRLHLPSIEWGDEGTARIRRRVAHFINSDAGGSWVVEVDGEVLGLAQAMRREALWVLAHLFIAPSVQNRGAGRALVDATLTYGSGTDPGIIVASPDPRAARLYVGAGFAFHPSAVAWGSVRRKGLRKAPAVRPGGVDYLEMAARVDRSARGAARTIDLELCLAEGDRLFVVPDRGYALLRRTRVATLSALDDEAATELLTAALAEADETGGVAVETGRILASQQWAVTVALEAGLELHAHGAVTIRGTPGPLHPYLFDGALG